MHAQTLNFIPVYPISLIIFLFNTLIILLLSRFVVLIDNIVCCLLVTPSSPFESISIAFNFQVNFDIRFAANWSYTTQCHLQVKFLNYGYLFVVLCGVSHCYSSKRKCKLYGIMSYQASHARSERKVNFALIWPTDLVCRIRSRRCILRVCTLMSINKITVNMFPQC